MEKTSIELRDTSLSLAPEGNAEQQQETSFTELNCKVCNTSLPEPHSQSCCGEHACQSCAPENQPCPLCSERGAASSAREDTSEDSWVMVEPPAEVSKPRESRKRRKSSPEAEPVAKRLRSGRQKVEHPSFSISKVQIPKQKADSPRFYTSKDGYLMQIKFRYNSKQGHGNNVHVYIHTHPGKNDNTLSWPLRGRVQILSIDLGGDTRHTSEIPGEWERPGTHCKGELDIPYEKLVEDKNGMLKFCVRMIAN